ncbi:hypothetical protein GCM10009863_42900 [Streptomyces axinellae]|uniref:Uncharacterized protein n=1 Tax=Streptomyces axinellae TaxID=552788 RepID=A0ABN3QDY8_9ACTN
MYFTGAALGDLLAEDEGESDSAPWSESEEQPATSRTGSATAAQASEFLTVLLRRGALRGAFRCMVPSLPGFFTV